MHNAPPVVYPLGRSAFQGWMLLGLWLAGLAVVFLWWQNAVEPGWRQIVALGGVSVAGGAALLGWRQAPAGLLQWDGQDWNWQSEPSREVAPVRSLQVTLDLQRCLLLRASNPDRAGLWLWTERASAPERWMDLRRALYARHRSSSHASRSLPGQQPL